MSELNNAVIFFKASSPMLLTYNQTAALKSTFFALCQHIFGALSTFFFIQFLPAFFELFFFLKDCSNYFMRLAQ